MKFRGNELARDFAAIKRDRQGNYRERVELSPGRFVLCESQVERNWWESFAAASKKSRVEFSLRDLYEHLVPNGRELAESFNPRNAGGSYMEAGGAVTSLEFDRVNGQIIYNMLMQDLTPEETMFQGVIPNQSTQFSGEKIAGIANLGDQAQVVAENTDFPLVGTSQDYIETPETTKRGFIVPITKEAIFFDRTGQLADKCSKVRESLVLNKEKRAIDCLIDENTTKHRYKWRGTSYASYQATSPWDNVTASNALVDWTDIDNANQTLNGITDPNTGEPVVIGADTLICTKQLEETANRIKRATTIVFHSGGYAATGDLTETQGPNPMKESYQVMTSRLVAARMATDTTYLYGSPRQYARYMENWPITVTTAPAGNYLEFSRDIVQQHKCSERGQYVVIEPRVLTQCTVA
jgi:hypothetical protein